MEQKERWLTSRQAQERLGAHERTLRKWAARGKLRRRRNEEGRVHFHAEDVERLAGEQRVAKTGPAPPSRPLPRATEERLADARAREQQLLQEIQWLRSQLERLHDTQRDLCLLLLQNGRGSDWPASLFAEKSPAREYR